MPDVSISALLIIGLAVVFLIGHATGKQSQRLQDLSRRVNDLEDSSARRHTHATLHGIHDAQALVVHALLRSMDTLNVSGDLLREALRILGTTSENPYAYKSGSSRRDEIIAAAKQRLKRELDSWVDEIEDLER